MRGVLASELLFPSRIPDLDIFARAVGQVRAVDGVSCTVTYSGAIGSARTAPISVFTRICIATAS